MEPNLQLVALDNDFNATPTKRLDYQCTIRSIMYAILGIQLDLAFTVSTLSKYYINLGPSTCLSSPVCISILEKDPRLQNYL